MPIIEYRSAGDEIGEAILSGVNSYMAFSEMHRRKAQDELDRKVTEKSLQWEQEDRDLETRQREAQGELASRMVKGTGTPSEIALRKGEEIAAAGMQGFMTGGLVGSLQGIATETPKAMQRAGMRTKRLDELMRDLSPQAQALARQDFARQGAIDVARSAQRDVAQHLKAVIRRGKMPGREEVLASLLENVETFDPETGIGMAPWEAEAEFRKVYQEWHADQADMQATQASVQSLTAMANAMGVGASPPVVAAVQALGSGGMTHQEAFKAILSQTREGRAVMDEIDRKMKAHNMALESFGEFEEMTQAELRKRTREYEQWLGGGQQGPAPRRDVPRETPGGGGEGKGGGKADPALVQQAIAVGIPTEDIAELGRSGKLEAEIQKRAKQAPKNGQAAAGASDEPGLMPDLGGMGPLQAGATLFQWQRTVGPRIMDAVGKVVGEKARKGEKAVKSDMEKALRTILGDKILDDAIMQRQMAERVKPPF